MLQLNVNDKANFKITQEGGQYQMDDLPIEWESVTVKPGHFHILHQGHSFNAEVVAANYQEKTFSIKVNGNIYEVSAKDKFDLLLEQLGISNLAAQKVNEIKAPMPGLVLEIMVEAGDTLQKDEAVLILEAMKMENVLKSPGEGTIKSIQVNAGDAVEKNQVLVILD